MVNRRIYCIFEIIWHYFHFIKSLCFWGHNKEIALNCLDAVRVIRVYLAAIASVCKRLSCFPLLCWRAYYLRDRVSSFLIRAYFTKVGIVSLAFQHQVSIFHICTGSSVHTICKFYQALTNWNFRRNGASSCHYECFCFFKPCFSCGPAT